MSLFLWFTVYIEVKLVLSMKALMWRYPCAPAHVMLCLNNVSMGDMSNGCHRAAPVVPATK